MDTFAERLTTLRKRAGYRQDDFADEVGVSVDTVRRWEAEKQEPRLGELKRIATVLHTTINDLAGEDAESIIETPQEKIQKPRPQKNARKGIIVIQQGNTRLEIPATSQGYAILKDKLKEVVVNQEAHLISPEV